MTDALPDILRFLFILVVPLVLVAGGAASLFALGGVIYAFEHPKALRSGIEAAFRQPEKPAREPGSGHYYQPYWNRDPPGETGGD